MIEKMPLHSLDIAAEQQEKLRKLFPEVFTEGNKINFDALRRTLGEMVDEGKERYGMNWPGKADCFRTIQQPATGTLVPEREQSIDFDASENVFIEGDNLEVLKLLQKSYLNKIKMIYIDPPYNTGNDFIYPDNFSENLDTYLEYTGQKDAQGRKFSTNTDTDGRFHSKWMNMMYPRLFLARNLLKEDGVIFISIDDSEVDNLKKICNEVFGEENFVANIIWEKRFTRSNNSKLFTTLTEHILLYRKSDILDTLKEPRNEKSDAIYSNPDNDIRGVWTSVSYVNPATKEQRPNLVYEIINPMNNQKILHPTNAWKYEYKTYIEHIKENRLYWGVNGNNTYPRLKKFLSEMEGGMVPANLWTHEDTGTTDKGSKVLENLFQKKIFDFPKPHSLIKRMMAIATQNHTSDLILDFFAGSATTAHAVLDLNEEDGGNRRFICVQLPEPCDESSEAYKAGFSTIADISKERIRRVIAQIKAKRAEAEAKKAGELAMENEALPQADDLGFRVFRLAQSHFKAWQGEVEKTPEAIQAALFDHIENVADDASTEAILYELLLKAGHRLSSKVAILTLAEQTVYSVSNGAMLLCLEQDIQEETLRAMAAMRPRRVLCLDEGFRNNDQLKTNAVLMMHDAGVTDFRTV